MKYKTWEEVDARVWELIRKMTALQIPYRHPPEGKMLANMKQHNPAGCALLDEYFELVELEKRLKDVKNDTAPK